MKKLLVLSTALAAAVAFIAGSAPRPAAAAPAAQAGLVSDINPGPAGSSPDAFTRVNGTLFFVADDGVHGLELWRSDGTAAGTVLVKDVDPGPGNGPTGLGGMVNVNGTLFFAADDGTTGVELWKSDGTAAGTTLVKDINPGSATSSSTPLHLTNVGGELFFTADDGSHGRELWKSDGTVSGTTMVDDIDPGSNGSNPTELVDLGGTLLFHADDGVHSDELWRSDGTSAGTTLVKDINPGGGSIISEPTNVNGTVYFSAFDGNNFGLWRSDGTPGGTALVKYLDSVAQHLTNVAGTLFFSADQGNNGRELWKSDGTPFGTAMVADIFPGPAASDPTALAVFNGTVFFQANDGTDGVELWKSDGTAAGTTLVDDINPADASSFPNLFTSSNGQLYFTATEFTDGRELWTTDGTTAGTHLVADLIPGATGSLPGPLADVNGTLFFGANDGTHGVELWKLAVTPAPTVTTGQATNISTDGVTLNGTVNPNGTEISDCHFEYGTTSAYDSHVACSVLPGAGTAPVAVSAALTGLGSGKTYDYRLVATGDGGTGAGSNATFTTASAPASTTLTTSQTAGLARGASIAVPLGTTGESDEATITGDNTFMAGGTVTFALYADPQCTAASQVFTSTNRTAGNPQPFALADSDPVNTVLAVGTYYWTAAYTGDTRNLPSSSPCGAETLTVQSVNPVKTSTTLATSQTAGLAQGASITVPFGTTDEWDRATITGDHTFMAGGTVTFALYSDAQCTAASQVFTSTNRTAGNPQPFALADSDRVSTRLDPGTYYWTATYSGDDRNLGSSSACGSEILTVQPLPPPPPATTLSSTQFWGTTQGAAITIPGSATGEFDEAHLSGTNAASASGEFVFALYQRTTNGAQCTGTPVFTSTVPLIPGLNGRTDSDSIKTQLDPGTYDWTVTYSGDSANQPSTSACGDEVLTVQPPQPTTLSTTQVWRTTQGASITVPGSATDEHDVARLSGANAAGASGSVIFNLYQRSTEGPQCTGTPVFSSTVPMLPGIATDSGPVKKQLAPGTYDWTVTYRGDPGNAPSASPCGDEVLTVQPPQPTTLSTTQVFGGTRGASITVPGSATGEHDEAQLSGANVDSATGSFIFSLYQRATAGPQCTGTPVFTSTVPLAPVQNGGASSEPVTTRLTPGTYDWTVTYRGDTDNQPSTSACGSEVLTIQPPQPTTLSTTQVWGTTRGASITIPGSATGEHDEAQLSGTNTATSSGSFAFNLYRRTGSGPQCTGTPVFTSTIPISPVENGGASSEPVTTRLDPGTYDWSVSYSGDAANQPSTSTCGDEVLTVQAPQPTTLSTTQVWGTTRGASITIPGSATNEHDEAQLAGINASSSSGSFTFKLFRRAVEGPQCTGTPAFTSTIPLSPAQQGGASSEPVTTRLDPGTYDWNVSYSGDAANEPSTSTCGDEVLTVARFDQIVYSIDRPSVAGPPYPTSPVVLRACGSLISSDPCTPVELLGLSLTSVCLPQDPCAPAAFRLDAAVSPDPIRATPATTPPDPIRQSFDLLVSLGQHPDATVAPVLVPPSPIVPPNPIKAFDVRYLVFLPNVAVTTETLHFAIAPNQPYVFTNIVVSPPHSPRFDVSFTLEPTGGAQQSGALWTVTPSGTIADPDTTPPVLSVPAGVTKEATGPSGAAVDYIATATDDLDPNPKVACTPASGGTFPLGDTTVKCTATDAGGNSASQSFAAHVVDTTPPALSLPGDLTATPGTNSGATVNYSASASDLVDGKVPVSCTPGSGSSFPVGSTTVTCSATDAHGNTATGTFKVTVRYSWSGLRAPVNNAPTVNTAKAGSAIPVKFSLSGNQGLAIFAAGSPQIQAVSCSTLTSNPVDPVETTVTAGSSSLTYDPTADQYSYVWKTQASWAGTCQRLDLKLADDTTHSAYFQFK